MPKRETVQTSSNDLPAYFALVEVENIRKESRGPNAAETALKLEKPHLLSGSRGAYRRSDSGGAPAGNDYVRPVVEGNVAFLFAKRAARHNCHGGIDASAQRNRACTRYKPAS